MSIVGDSVLYYPNPRLLSMDRQGAIRWTNHFGGGTGPQVVAADGTIYFQTGGSLVALNPDSSMRWAVGITGSRYSPPSLGDQGMIYCASDAGTLSAFDSNGSLGWTCVLDDHRRDIYAAPAIGDDGVLYCGFREGLSAVSNSGTVLWTFSTGHDVRTTPAIAADGTIYFGCYDHYLYALNHDGSKKWRYYVGGSVRSSPVIGQDGRVYFTSSEGYLYAIEGGSPPAPSPWPMYLHDARHTGWAGTP
jgi:outer membrane protein assembly factor BamB